MGLDEGMHSFYFTQVKETQNKRNMKNVKFLIFRKFPIGYIQNFKIETWVGFRELFFFQILT